MIKRVFFNLLFVIIVFVSALIFSHGVSAQDLPPGVKPQQVTAKGDYVWEGLGTVQYTVTFWNVGELYKNSSYGEAEIKLTCAGGTGDWKCVNDGEHNIKRGTFSGGPNGTFNIDFNKDIQSFRLEGGRKIVLAADGQSVTLTVENPEVFDGWYQAVSDDNKENEDPGPGVYEDSGAGLSDTAGTVEVNMPNADGTYDPENWQFIKLDGRSFPVGTHIKTGDNSSAIITFGDMTNFVMKPNTEVILPSPVNKDEGTSKGQINLLWGNLKANVKKMMKDGTMEIEMSQAVAGIKGTQFILNDTGTESSIRVTEGIVKFTSKSTGMSIDVGKGEAVVASAKGLSEKTFFDPVAEEKKWQELTDNMKKRNTGFFDNKNIVYILGGIIIAVITVSFSLHFF